jgi:hyperosmotically inducible periplasmic protein
METKDDEMNMVMRLLKALAIVGLLGAPVAACSGESAGEYVDDSVISNTVRAKLIDDPDLNIFQVDVTTLQGEVQISGFVESQADKDRAGEVARSVDGVREVHNNLVVR